MQFIEAVTKHGVDKVRDMVDKVRLAWTRKHRPELILFSLQGTDPNVHDPDSGETPLTLAAAADDVVRSGGKHWCFSRAPTSTPTLT